MERLGKFIIAGLMGLMLASAAAATEKVHRVAVHVDQNDEAVMNLALNNVENIIQYYQSKGESAIVEVVAYGPGLNMFVAGKSPVSSRIETMALEMDNLVFSGCGNTHRKMSAKAGKDVPIMSEVSMVPSGIVRLIELQDEGYAYVRP